MVVTVRALSRAAEYEQAEAVQASAWGGGDRGVTPKEVLIAIQDNGGLVLGAFDGRSMVGYSLLMIGYRGGSAYMYSHQTGVTKEYQSKGVGYLLKRRQAVVALRRGFDMIAWTFDPLIGRNAHFNMKKLGVVARNYLLDYYGPMDDAINWGLPTDRLLCEWYIRPSAQRSIRSNARGVTEQTFRVIERGGSEPYPVCRDWRIDVSVDRALLDVPRDIVLLKRKDLAEARRWREATRDAFRSYFGAGFAAVALLEEAGVLRYLLTKAALPENIFGRR
ncbi:MAG: GNAT family N-acetyltransferase [Thaumarchaeota archaeon]|nr:GNAT family N-acetyltransferase [Nitrososphaerota archaeon]